MKLNIEEWLHYFEDSDLPTEEKEELIRVIWHAMRSEAEQAFRRNPVQLAKKDGKV